MLTSHRGAREDLHVLEVVVDEEGPENNRVELVVQDDNTRLLVGMNEALDGCSNGKRHLFRLYGKV